MGRASNPLVPVSTKIQLNSFSFSRPRPGENGDPAGDIGGGVGDKNLAPVDHPFVAVQDRRGLGVSGIGPGVGFGEAESPEHLAAAEFGQVFSFLFLAGVIIQGADAQGVAGGDGGGMEPSTRAISSTAIM
jgi:hypothetical protein